MKFKSNSGCRQGGSILLIPNDYIVPNPNQPRKQFDYNELQSLADSIRNNGIVQPIVVRRIDDSNYELISGERRLRAARLVGLLTVPCIVMTASDNESALYAVIENLQRENLNFFEEAMAIEKLSILYKMTQEEIARKLGKSQSSLSNKLRLLKISNNMRSEILSAGLSERHARALLKLESEDMREKALGHIISNNLNVAETDNYIAKLLDVPKIVKQPPKFKKLKDIKIFVNTINHAIDTMRRAGIEANSCEHETSDYYEYVVRIPKMTSSPVSLAEYTGNAV